MRDFCGHPTASIENGKIRLEYLTDVGPRIARLFPGDQPSLLAELPDLTLDTEYGTFAFMGGHHLWHSPESLPLTYVPDQPVTIEELTDGVRISGAKEPGTGVAKTIELQLAKNLAVITVNHILKNQGPQEVEYAPWALSMFRLGGVVILPQPQAEAKSLQPNRHLALWPYTRLDNSRLQLGDDFILVSAGPDAVPLKLGEYNTHGWVAYWLEGTLAVKRFSVAPLAGYPDGGCNVEIYCKDRFVELETLGPLAKLAPGQTATHQEIWEFYEDLDQHFIPSTLRQHLSSWASA